MVLLSYCEAHAQGEREQKLTCKDCFHKSVLVWRQYSGVLLNLTKGPLPFSRVFNSISQSSSAVLKFIEVVKYYFGHIMTAGQTSPTKGDSKMFENSRILASFIAFSFATFHNIKNEHAHSTSTHQTLLSFMFLSLQPHPLPYSSVYCLSNPSTCYSSLPHSSIWVLLSP